MKKYQWILFDADETLFHFDSYAGLQHLFKQYNIDFTQSDFLKYQTLNKNLWYQYQQHKITAKEVQTQRFHHWAKKLMVEAVTLNQQFMQSMASISKTFDGTKMMLDQLKGDFNLGIITNGFTALQQDRLERTGLTDYFKVLIISEEVGVAKPHPDIFNHALTMMDNPSPAQVLMVGDNLHSDIIGGNQAGMDTCWFNPDNKAADKVIKPTYVVSEHTEILSLVQH